MGALLLLNRCIARVLKGHGCISATRWRSYTYKIVKNLAQNNNGCRYATIYDIISKSIKHYGGSKMVLQDSFVTDLTQAENEYDVMAFCYDEMLKYISDTDVGFVAKIDCLESDVEFKPFAQKFEELRQIIISSSDRINVHCDSDGIGFDAFKNILIETLRSFQCPEQIEQKKCLPVCLFYVLEALDIHIEKNLSLVLFNYRTLGPLNRDRNKSSCLVYLHERESFLSTSYTKKNGGFRRPLRNTRIGGLFHTVLLMPRERNSIAPHIIPVFLDETCRATLNSKRTLKIASIPYIGFDTFSFHEVGAISPCAPNQTPKGQFYIDYDEPQKAETDQDNQEDDVQRITALLKTAINRKPNIIVFPEYIMSPKMLKGIQDCLKDLDPNKKSDLFLVLAGTCYHWNEGRGNNILHLLNARGTEIGSYYKSAPFLVRTEEGIHGQGSDASCNKTNGSQTHPEQQSTAYMRRRYLEICEILSDSGKECALIDVDVIGRILPAICRDVIDGYTEYLSNIFVPSFLLVPAWSRSVASFNTKFESLAKNIHTISLLCNCCNAVQGTDKTAKAETGTIVVPQKRETRMDISLQTIIRDKNCASHCKEHGGCVAQIEISFAEMNPRISLNTFFPK